MVKKRKRIEKTEKRHERCKIDQKCTKKVKKHTCGQKTKDVKET